MASQPLDGNQSHRRLSLRGRARRKLGHVLTPVAKRMLGWCEGSHGHPVRTFTEARLHRLEERATIAEWGREALVERINEQDARLHKVEKAIATMEPLLQHAYWGREALVDRVNDTDYKLYLIESRIDGVQTQIDEHVPVPRAMGFDALAMGRRLATIEDQLEAITAPAGQSREGAATLVPFPSHQQPAQAAG